MKLNGIWRSNGFTFLFKIEKWNKDEDPYELRLYILFWEFNFSIKNNNPIKWFEEDVDEEELNLPIGTDIEIRDKLMSLRTNDERRHLLYDWVISGDLTFEQFDLLIYYCS